MSKFTVEFDTDNDAFTPDGEEEVARILGELSAKVRSGYREAILRDVNGNTVGRFEWTP